MEIRHLKLIKEVAEKGSLTKAMDTLYLSQSALSHQLKEVESQLGAQLFHRVNKKLVITGAGRIVLQSAERILSTLDETEKSVKKYIGGDKGTVRVATECHTCYHWLPQLMLDFKNEFPNVDIEIFPEAITEPMCKVLTGELDLGITSDPIEDPNLKYTELFKDELMALLPANHPLTRKKYLYPEDFIDEVSIIHSYPLDSVTLFKDLLIPHDIKPKKILEIPYTEAMVQMVKAGMGIKVIANWIIEPYLQDKALDVRPVTRKGLWRTWYAVTLNKPETPQYLENFIDHLRCNIAGICKI